MILTRQCKIPTYLNGNTSRMLIESCAGLLTKTMPKIALDAKQKRQQDTKISSIEKIFEAYMSSGSVTDIVHFFIPEYNNAMKIGEGGGSDVEQEKIEVLEMDFNVAFRMMASGEIKDGKTIILLQHLQIKGIISR